MDNSGRINIGFNQKNTEHQRVNCILNKLPKGAKAGLIVRAVIHYLETPPDEQLRNMRELFSASGADILELTALLDHLMSSGNKVGLEELQELMGGKQTKVRSSCPSKRKPPSISKTVSVPIQTKIAPTDAEEGWEEQDLSEQEQSNQTVSDAELQNIIFQNMQKF